MKSLLLCISIIAMVSNCQDTIKSTDITKIEYGTSFGSCLGYCNNVASFTPEKIVKVLTAARSQELPTNECTKIWKGFNQLASKVDHNQFSSLEETIGCPDCADGGAEWIENLQPKVPRK